jgi:hypothetical protein
MAIRTIIALIFCLTALTNCNKGSNSASEQEKDTLESVPEENVRPTGDMRSVPSESPSDSVITDSIK